MGQRVNEILTWDFMWRRLLFVHDEQVIANFNALFQGHIFFLG